MLNGVFLTTSMTLLNTAATVAGSSFQISCEACGNLDFCLPMLVMHNARSVIARMHGQSYSPRPWLRLHSVLRDSSPYNVLCITGKIRPWMGSRLLTPSIVVFQLNRFCNGTEQCRARMTPQSFQILTSCCHAFSTPL